MFSYWLEDDLQASWEKVSGAVKKVRKRVEAATAREESRRNIEGEENKAVSAIDQLQKSLDEMDTTNTKIAENQTRLVEEVKEQERKWESYQAQWGREDMEWNEGEQRRKQIKEALEAHNLQRSQFVKRFLREKQLPDNLSSQEIECYLRKDLVEIEITGSRQMRSRRQQGQKHHKELQHLLEEINKWKKLVEDRITGVYANVAKKLEELGLKTEKLRDLERQLEKLKKTLEKCTKAVNDCNQALGEGEKVLQMCEEQLREFSESFSEVVKEMEKVLGKLENNVGVIERNLCAITGAVLGSIAGTAVLPVIGTAIGGAVGLVAGKAIDVARGETIDQKQEKLRLELETKKRTLTNCKATQRSAKQELEKLMSKPTTPMWMPAWNIQYGRNVAY